MSIHQGAAPPWCLPPSMCRSRVDVGAAAAAAAATWRSFSRSASASGSYHAATNQAVGDPEEALTALSLMDAIHLKGLVFHGHHGVLPEVRRARARCVVVRFGGDG